MKGLKILSIILMTSLGTVTTANAQILILTVGAIIKSTKPADKKLMTRIEGEWMFQEARIDNLDVMDSFDQIKIYFPKCKKADKKANRYQSIYVYNDIQTDYFKNLLQAENKVSITSRKIINKEAKAMDASYEKVKYELVSTEDSKYEFSMKFKKDTLRIETIGKDDHSEFFLLVRPAIK